MNISNWSLKTYINFKNLLGQPDNYKDRILISQVEKRPTNG